MVRECINQYKSLSCVKIELRVFIFAPLSPRYRPRYRPVIDPIIDPGGYAVTQRTLSATGRREPDGGGAAGSPV